MTETAETIIKSFEGLRLKAYSDVVGVVTIGYGETGKHITPGMRISIEQAEKYLRGRIERLQNEIDTLVKVPLNDNQLSALISLCYNIGINAFASSTLLVKLNKSQYVEAADQFLRWDHAGGKIIAGLTKRRKAERKLFLEPV
jgi:lysozyme